MTAERLAALHAACFTTPRPWSARELRDLTQSPLVFLLEVPAGFALGRAVAGEAELLTLAVAPEARRRGLGRSLLERFEATARQRGADSAFLEVSADNAPAIALYRDAGYSPTGRRPGYYRTPEGQRIDACLYGKPLSGDKTG